MRQRRNIPQEMAQAIADVFDDMGGKDGLLAWALRHPEKFYMFLWPKLLPKVIDVGVERESQQQLPTVMVVDAQTALVALERMTDDHYAIATAGGEGDTGEMEGQQQTHEVRVSEVDGGIVGAEEASSTPNATEARKDAEFSIGTSVRVSDYIPTS